MINDPDKYEVFNLGIGARTVMKTGDYPYY